jgi:RNA polymerase sigma factor (sigma-70 family)
MRYQPGDESCRACGNAKTPGSNSDFGAGVWRVLQEITLSCSAPGSILGGMTWDADKRRAPDTGMIGELDRRFRLPLIAYFRRRVSSASEAEDLTQDVFERVLKALSHAPIVNAEALVFRIAVNLLRDRARRESTRGGEQSLTSENIVALADALTVDLSPERVVLGERTLADVIAALQELGERTQAIFYLYRLENLKIREIAAIYGISASAVEKHVSKALLHLTRRQEEG